MNKSRMNNHRIVKLIMSIEQIPETPYRIISNINQGVVFFQTPAGLYWRLGLYKRLGFYFSTLQFILVNQLCWDDFHINCV